MSRSAWDFLLERRTPQHVHGCPACYEKWVCTDDCTIEHDLELSDGTPSGAYCYCSKECAESNDQVLDEAYGPGVRTGPTSYRPPSPE